MSSNTTVIHQTGLGDTFPWLHKSKYDGARLYDPDYALTKDGAAYEKMLRDPIIRQALQVRYRVAAGGTWSMVPAREGDEADERAAEVMEQCLSEIRSFQNCRVKGAQAIFRGSSYLKIEGQRALKSFGDDKPREWWVPTALPHVDKRFVRRIPKKSKEFESEMEIFTRTKNWVPMPTRDFIHVIYDDDQGRTGYGRGLAESVYFLFYAKVRALEHGLSGMERWAKGILIAKIDESAPGDVTQTTADTADAMLEMIHKIRSNHGAVIGSADEVTSLETSGTGHKIVTDVLKYCDDGITRLITGSLLPAGGGSEVGSLARADVELEISDSVAQLDSEILDDAISADLVELTWELNQEPLSELGLSEARMPKYKSINERKEDTEKNARVITQGLGAGIPFKREEVYDKLGMTPPGPDDDVIEGTQAPEPDLLGVGSEL